MPQIKKLRVSNHSLDWRAICADKSNLGERQAMRLMPAVVLMVLGVVGPAMAVEYRTPVTKQLYTCASEGWTRVAMPATSEPCCEGRLKCAEFLSTGGVLKSLRDPRT